MNDRVDKIVSTLSRSEQITLIPVERLRVLNPRTRNPYFFSQLVENIASVGLKRPITVAHGGRDAEGEWHEVLCGQGRLEALKALGETVIPCSIVEASEIDRYLITLTENIARRRHSTAELLGGLQVLRAKGYTTEDIAKKTNLDDAYVNGILQLLEKGEQRLLQAVENRVAAGGFNDPLWLAKLDVQFAALYFGALRAALTGAPCPGSWNAMFSRRDQAEIARIQFALAGMNAHINHDLPFAIVATCKDRNTVPQHGTPQYTDYTAINTTLDGLIDAAKLSPDETTC